MLGAPSERQRLRSSVETLQRSPYLQRIASLVALYRGRGGLSVGNLMGSNVLYTLLVPGIAAAMSPIIVPAGVLVFDIPVQAVVTVLVLVFLYLSPRGIRMPEALVLLGIYLSL